eukprot:12014343-Heterocapsa_arctica.AAC.1
MHARIPARPLGESPNPHAQPRPARRGLRIRCVAGSRPYHPPRILMAEPDEWQELASVIMSMFKECHDF